MKKSICFIMALVILCFANNTAFAAETVADYEMVATGEFDFNEDNGEIQRAGGCSNWEVYDQEPNYCDTEDGCGPFWAQDTNKQKLKVKRTCVNANNNYYTEYGTTIQKLGCC